MRQNGIQRQLTCNYTPQQNGFIERKSTIFIDIPRELFNQMHMPLHYWVEVVDTLVHIINITPTTINHGILPFEKHMARNQL